MKSLNQVTIMGNLVRDPEVKYTGSGQAVCNMTLALNSSYQDKNKEWQESVEYIDCVAWGTNATNAEKYLSKGKQVLISGKLKTSSWEQKDGQKRTKIDILVSDMMFVHDPASKGRSDAHIIGKESEARVNDLGDTGDGPINLDDIPF